MLYWGLECVKCTIFMALLRNGTGAHYHVGPKHLHIGASSVFVAFCHSVYIFTLFSSSLGEKNKINGSFIPPLQLYYLPPSTQPDQSQPHPSMPVHTSINRLILSRPASLALGGKPERIDRTLIATLSSSTYTSLRFPSWSPPPTLQIDPFTRFPKDPRTSFFCRSPRAA